MPTGSVALCRRGLFGGRRPARLSRPPLANGSMRALLQVILIALDLYTWLLIAAAVVSWLIAFNVVNTHHQVVAMAAAFLYRITETAWRPIRNVMPHLGGIDISPVILILIIYFIKQVIVLYIYPAVF